MQNCIVFNLLSTHFLEFNYLIWTQFINLMGGINKINLLFLKSWIKLWNWVGPFCQLENRPVNSPTLIMYIWWKVPSNVLSRWHVISLTKKFTEDFHSYFSQLSCHFFNHFPFLKCSHFGPFRKGNILFSVHFF